MIPETRDDKGGSGFILRGYRCRLEPQRAANRDLFGFADARRWVWNGCVAFMQDANLAAKAAGGTWPKSCAFSLGNLCSVLDQWCEEKPWLQLVPKQVLQQAVHDFIAARGAFLSGSVSAPPQFAKANEATPTCRFPQHVRLNQEAVFLPKLGWVKFRNSFGKGVPPGALRSATVKFEDGHWFVTLLMKQPRPEVTEVPIKATGIDSGVKHTLALSSRKVLQAPIATEAEQKRIRFLERRLARCTRGSNRYAKALHRLNKFRSSINRRIHDWRHKKTTALSKNHGLIAAEKLTLRGMTASARGTVDTPGTNVAQKAGLNRSLLEPGIGIIMSLLAYKQDWRGHAFVQVEPAHTSQHCPHCEHTAAENRPSRDRFRCVKCGHEDEADFVAAQNILHLGRQNCSDGRTDRVSAPVRIKRTRGTMGTSHSRTKPSQRSAIAA